MKPISESVMAELITEVDYAPAVIAQPSVISIAACLRLARKSAMLFIFGAAPWLFLLWICGII